MPRLLDGIKVLEVANYVAVPAASTMLSDLGAEVTKVEPPDTGDPGRGLDVTHRGVVPHTGGVNTAFEFLNRGKRSVGINLGAEGGREAVKRLAAASDVMLTNLTPHRQVRYDLTYDAVSRLNPRLVYVTLTGYGMEGEEKDRSGFDYTAFWARSGVMAMLGEEGEMPVQERPAMGDLSTALAITSAVGMALFERERSGMGQQIDCSLLHTGLWVMGNDLNAALKERKPIRRNRRKQANNPLFNFYEAGDGKWLQLVMLEGDRWWSPFCRVMGLEAIRDDPRFDTLGHRMENNGELIAILDERFATRPRAGWAERLDSENCTWAPIQTPDEVIDDPQARANGYFTTIRHQTGEETELVSPPLTFHRTPGQPSGPGPEPGQDTEAKLLEIGYTWEQIEALKQEGAII